MAQGQTNTVTSEATQTARKRATNIVVVVIAVAAVVVGRLRQKSTIMNNFQKEPKQPKTRATGVSEINGVLLVVCLFVVLEAVYNNQPQATHCLFRKLRKTTVRAS
jgi:uncharacterized membrane protein YidH (DUF202 family)